MGNSGKIISIVIVVFIGVFALSLMQKAGGGSMVFFGLFGVAIFFVIKSLFKNDKSDDKDFIENTQNTPKEYLAEKDVLNKDNQEFTKEQIFAMGAIKIAFETVPKYPESPYLSIYGQIETLLYNSVIIIKILNGYENQTKKLHLTYFDLLFNHIVAYETPILKEEVKNFIFQRFKFYTAEIDILSSDVDLSRWKIYTAFYVEPLTESIDYSYDLKNNILLFSALFKMNTYIEKEVISLINNTL